MPRSSLQLPTTSLLLPIFELHPLRASISCAPEYLGLPSVFRTYQQLHELEKFASRLLFIVFVGFLIHSRNTHAPEKRE